MATEAQAKAPTKALKLTKASKPSKEPRVPKASTKKSKANNASDAHARAVEILGLGRPVGPEELTELATMRTDLRGHDDRREKVGDHGDAAYVSYPSIEDPKFASKIVAKREFAEHAVDSRKGQRGCSTAAEPTNFELTRTQLIVRNFLAPGTPYNGLLLYMGVGVGKSCTAVTVAEQCLDLGAQTKVLVITRPGLRENFRKTVFDIAKVPRKPDGSLDYGQASQCTGTSYPDRVQDRRSLTEDQVKAKIDRLIRNRYEFMGVGEFANVVESLGSGPATLAVERLRQRFSNLVMIVDEAHNLRIGGNEGGAEGEGRKIKRATPALRRVLRCTENVKLLLLTATPMFNKSADVLDLINLLLANDKRNSIKTSDVFDKTGALTKEGDARLRAASRGYVSYAAVDDPFSFPMRLWPSEGRDPTVLRPKDVPRTDIRGDPIPAHMRLHANPGVDLEIVVSPLGVMQKDAYTTVEEKLRTTTTDDDELSEDDEKDETDDVDDKKAKGSNAASALYTGLQACNVAFPNQLKFDGCFKKHPMGSGMVQLDYRPGVPRFLEPSKLAQYAPKIAAIVKRIQACRGIVMVYSRFLPSGLIPLAIALEHVGFRKFESSSLLRGGGGGEDEGGQEGGRGGRHRREGHRVFHDRHERHEPPNRVYAIISGNREYRTDEARTVQALTSKENKEGHVIKVILVSDRGSEGIDLKFVREVHVLEPWFHLNKIEQVVGRAARFCSHSALPPEDRNLTVYLHAITKGSGNVETVDLRAYRLAEHKSVQIKKVEKVLRSVSFDCRLREAGTESILAEAAKERVSVRTSQGVELKNVPLLNGSSRSGSCEGPEVSANGLDESTYDPTGKHAFHHATYSNLLRNYFKKTGRPSSTFDELIRHVTVSLKETDSSDEILERTATELDLLVKSGREVEGPHGGRLGSIVHRGDLYVFQPTDEDTRVLTDAERSAKHRRDPLALDVALLQHHHRPAHASNPDGRRSRSIRSAEQALIGLDTDVSSLLSRAQVVSGPYRNVAVDFVIDRMPHVRLVRLATACVMDPAVLELSYRLSRERAQASRSLRSAGKLMIATPHHLRNVRRRGSSEFHSATLISPYLSDGRVVRIDARTGLAKEEIDLKIIKDSAKIKRRLITKEVVGAVVTLPNEGRAVFKVLEDRLERAPARRSAIEEEDEVRTLSDGGRGSGCVCHQSAVLTTERLRELIAEEAKGEPTAIAAAQKVSDKRTLCELYELVLRKHRASALVP